MYPLIEAYLAGSQCRLDFCQAHGLNISTLSYWGTHYRKAQAAYSSTSQEESGGFVPLSLTDAGEKIHTAVLPDHLFPKLGARVIVLVQILLSKYADHVMPKSLIGKALVYPSLPGRIQ